MGVLRISGTLDLSQFWPKGAVGRNKGSDADTIRVVVKPRGVLFNGRPTSALRDSYVVDRGAKKLAINSKGEVSVRLQGVDAPELHFPTGVRKEVAGNRNGDFRQAWSEKAARELARILQKKFGPGPLDCEVVSQNIHKPGDICDSHGRVVGNVIVNGFDINLWLLDEGWSFPTFYHTMLTDEIQEATARARRAHDGQKGAWGQYETIAFFDSGMRYRRDANGSVDKGPVLLPKLFRRCSTSHVTHGSLANLMADIRQSAKDRFVPTPAFLAGSTAFRQWARGENGVIRLTPGGRVRTAVMPWQFVLKEEPSTLQRDENGQRKEVTSF